MARSKQKILKTAAKLANKGQYERAINEYRKLTQEEYGESSLANIIGDLLVQAKQTNEAIVEYEKAAQYYEDKGFIPKALAIYRKILRHDKALARIYERLAQLYSDQGLIQDAITQYEHLAKLHEHEGNKEAALDSYRQIADLDPQNLSIRERLAELYAHKGFKEKSCEERVKIGDRYVKRGDTVAAINSYEEALKEIPDFESALKGIVSVYISEKKIGEAKDILKRILDRTPDNVSALSTLGRVYMDNGQLDEAIEVFQRVNKLDPTQEGVNEVLGRIYLLKGNYKEAFQRLKEIINASIEHEEYQHALTILDQLQEYDPKNIVVLEKKVEVYQKLEREEDLRDTYTQMAELYYEKGRLEEAYNIYERLFALDPNDSSIKQRFNQISIELRGRPIEVSKLVEKPTFGSMIDEKKSEDKEFILDESSDFDIESDSNALESLFDTSEIEKISIPMFGESDIAESADALSEQLADDIFTVEGEDESDESAVPAAAKDVIEPSDDQIREFRIEAGVFMKYGLLEKALDRLKSILVMSPEDDETLEKLCEVYEKLGQPERVADTLLKRIDIADKQGDSDYAKQLIHDAAEQFPDNDRIILKLNELGKPPSVPVSDDKPFVDLREATDMEPLVEIGSDAVAVEHEDDSKPLIDLESATAAAKKESETLTNGLSEVVKEFREDLISRSETKDFETHYNLGIAYKEMGLIDEAISEFKISVDSDEYHLQSADMMAQCFIEKNEVSKAVSLLNRAIKSSSEDLPELLNLKYDLALAKKMIGETGEALKILNEINNKHKKFRNVKELINDLKKA